MQESQPGYVLNFLIRALAGFALIFFINQFLEMKGLAFRVGLNPVTFLVSGVFGTPGVALLYGIRLYTGL